VTTPKSGPAYAEPTEPTSSSHFNAANNRLNMTGASYDASGNQTAYDGEGRRVKKTSGGVTTYYIHDALGRLAAEYSNAASPSTGVSYLFTDMLGSVRTITNATGAVVECYDYMPFGQMLTASDNGRSAAGCYPAAPDPADSRASQKFTGKERDAETGLDYFGARYFSGAEGRFMTPDPLMASAKAYDPQTWNRYSYTLNNPLRFIDPDGLEVPEECVNNPDCKIKVSINVIYDKKANKGKGISDEEKNKFKNEQLEKAKKDYGKSNIILDIKYTAGEYDSLRNTTSGLDVNSINIVVKDYVPPSNNRGASGITGNGVYSVSMININSANEWNGAVGANTTEHEIGHHFRGDVYNHRTIGNNLIWDAHLYMMLNMQSVFGVSQRGFREGLASRRYAVPLNPEANKPKGK
jgi:RHS repeat-associated protein